MSDYSSFCRWFVVAVLAIHSLIFMYNWNCNIKFQPLRQSTTFSRPFSQNMICNALFLFLHTIKINSMQIILHCIYFTSFLLHQCDRMDQFAEHRTDIVGVNVGSHVGYIFTAVIPQAWTISNQAVLEWGGRFKVTLHSTPNSYFQRSKNLKLFMIQLF